jgi:hypothetical protein
VSWSLRFRSDPEPWKDAQVGNCWYYPSWDDPEQRQWFLRHLASRQFLEQHASRRAPVLIYFPPGFAFSPDEFYRNPDNPNPTREGWTVTGSIEDGSLSVSPSLVLGSPGHASYYHGFINQGVLSDSQ